MKERSAAEGDRSAVTGNVIKLKVKKSSKDKEVRTYTQGAHCRSYCVRVLFHSEGVEPKAAPRIPKLVYR